MRYVVIRHVVMRCVIIIHVTLIGYVAIRYEIIWCLVIRCLLYLSLSCVITWYDIVRRIIIWIICLLPDHCDKFTVFVKSGNWQQLSSQRRECCYTSYCSMYYTT